MQFAQRSVDRNFVLRFWGSFSLSLSSSFSLYLCLAFMFDLEHSTTIDDELQLTAKFGPVHMSVCLTLFGKRSRSSLPNAHTHKHTYILLELFHALTVELEWNRVPRFKSHWPRNKT